MKYLDDYKNPSYLRTLLDAAGELAAEIPGKARFMEVCGTHTMLAARLGLRKILPPQVELISGPGCPVCVSPASFIARALEYSREKGVAVATFGDMLKVPAGGDSLEKRRARGADIRVVYSPLDALRAAEEDKSKKVVFLGVGFETTAPSVAACVEEARGRGVKNFFVLSGHKTVPRALEAVVNDPGLQIQGFICPGHVSAVAGSRQYDFIAHGHGLPCVVAGFEPLDLLQAVCMLLRQVLNGESSVENQYSRAAGREGNLRAVEALYRVFEPEDSEWRGLGVIPASGLRLRSEYSGFDAEKEIPVRAPDIREPEGCICGDVLKGKARPGECALFGKRCSPSEPAGACMVSSEGACAAAYRYGN